MDLIKCPKCGQEINKDSKFCPNCGCKMEEEKVVEPVVVTEASEETKKELKKSKTVLGIVVLVTALLLCGAGLYFYFFNNKDYETDYANLATKMLSSGAEAEKCGNLIVKVWYNSIFKVEDSETDKYTKSLTGTFNDDFNDSLRNLFNDKSFSNKINKLKSDQSEIKRELSNLKNPPNDYEKAYKDLKRLYEDYLDLTNLVINPNGNLSEFTTKFKQYDTNMVTSYKKVKSFLGW